MLSGKIKKFPEKEIKTTGYVIYTLEASIWSLMNTNSFEKCVLQAVNLGEDTDTTAAVAGGLAGIFYGRKAIPQKWLRNLVRLEDIEELLRKLDIKYAEY